MSLYNLLLAVSNTSKPMQKFLKTGGRCSIMCRRGLVRNQKSCFSICTRPLTFTSGVPGRNILTSPSCWPVIILAQSRSDTSRIIWGFGDSVKNNLSVLSASSPCTFISTAWGFMPSQFVLCHFHQDVHHSTCPSLKEKSSLSLL